MRFRAESLRLQNFLSYRDSSLQLAHRGVVLLKGLVENSGACSSNGAGKTAAVPDGLLYALYGKTLRGASGKSVVSDERAGNDGKNCLVTLTGWDGDTPVILQRPQQHRSITKPSIQIGSDKYIGDDEVKRVLNMLLSGVDFQTFSSALVFGKGDVNFFTEQSDADRKHVLGKILNFEEIDAMAKAVKDAMAERAEEATEVARQISAIDATLRVLTVTKQNIEERLATADARRLAERTALAQDLQNLLADQKAQKTQLAVAKKSIVLLEKKFKQSITDKKDATEVVETVSKRRQQLQSRCFELSSSHRSIQEQIATLEQLTGKTCPSCQQAVKPAVAAKLLGPMRIAAETIQNQCQDEQAGLRTLDGDLGLAQQCLVQAQREAAENGAAVARTEANIIALTKSLKQIDVRLAELERRDQSMAQDTDADQANLADITKQLDQLAADVVVLTKRVRQLEAESALDQYWKVGFGPAGLRSMLLDQRCPELNVYARQYSEALTDGEIQVRFNTQGKLSSGELREKFTVEVMIHGYPTTYQLCSDGQRRRVDVITSLALSDLAAKQVGGAFNVLVLDEIFDGLDAVGMERAVSLLLAMGRESVFVVTHAEAMANLFTTVETVQYQNGISSFIHD